MDETGKDAEGGKAESGARIEKSGFGGLGLEGIVGMEEPAVGTAPPGVGSKGAMSGDNSWKGD